ncbi:MAG: hypothetical protein M1819_005744 [Sarea resinae]|nr:MAG: hypothetical protein M1819_005744 [Sarea resinae]
MTHQETQVRYSKSLPDDYELIEGTPSIQEYLDLRRLSGLSPKTEAQATAALPGGWYAVHVVHTPTNVAVGVGRIIGDGGWYFHIVDMAVLPEHQRKGLGDIILRALLKKIKTEAPPGAYITLLADPPGRKLYGRHGFTETAPGTIGMWIPWEK